MKLEPHIAKLHPSLRNCGNCNFSKRVSDPTIVRCGLQRCHVQREGRICKDFAPFKTKVVS